MHKQTVVGHWIFSLVTGLLLSGCGSSSTVAGTPDEFGLAQVREQAQALAQKPFLAPPKVPQAAADIKRDTWSKIDYSNAHALWHGNESSFEVQFFHAGSFYGSAVQLHQITPDGVKPITFSKRGFVYPEKGMRDQLPDDIGYAGFRLHYPVNKPGKMDEVATFLGASYFRGLGKDQVYGLSGRGAAIDTALNSGEEFPVFREFWLEQPGPDAQQMTVYALMDSPSLTGAYQFVIRPGDATVMDVKARLFPRKPIKKLGLGALTSMFMFGESSLTASRDWRPEMHDSDGLLVVDGSGEWLWRPLVNPGHLAVNSLTAASPQGFGLIQNDRDFDHYYDLYDNYERRPSAWITPAGDWGPGRVELVQIPSDSEQNDNIVAYWVSEKAVKPGRALDYDYQIKWSLQRPAPPTTGQVDNTLVGAIPPHENAPAAARRIAVDFVGASLIDHTDAAAVQARITVGQGGKLMVSTVRRNPHTHGLRLEFDVLPESDSTVVELRAFLADEDGQPLTETWSYALNQ